MTTKNQIAAEVLQRGLDDWVSLAEVAGVVRSHSVSPDTADVMLPTIGVIEELLNKGLVKVGDLVGSGNQIRFQPWEVSVRAAVDEIEKRWLEYGGPLGRDGANDVCWISNTQEGDELARRCQEDEREA
jgi:hypothetical protein